MGGGCCQGGLFEWEFRKSCFIGLQDKKIISVVKTNYTTHFYATFFIICQCSCLLSIPEIV